MTNDDIHTQKAAVRQLQKSELYWFLRPVLQTIKPSEAFVAAPYLEAMCKAVQDAVDDGHARLLITVPPRYKKSTVCTVGLSAFYLGHNPGKEVLVASHSAEFATLHSNEFRSVVEAAWYRRLFPDMLIDPRPTGWQNFAPPKAGHARLSRLA